MPLWLLLTLMGLMKLLVASLMLWLPLRSDSAMSALEDEPRPDADADDDGGGSSKLLSGPAGGPHSQPSFPRRPRRGPHGSPSSPSPARVRSGSSRRVVARTTSR